VINSTRATPTKRRPRSSKRLKRLSARNFSQRMRKRRKIRKSLRR